MAGVTKEQIQAAREADLFAYLQFHEPGVLKRDGPNYRHKEHDSLVYVTGKRYWYWNSRGRSINALDYLIQIRGYGLVDAVHTLVGGEIQQEPIYRSTTVTAHVQKEPEKKIFSLPWARRCATSAVSYLQRRGISPDVISRCFREGLFYEARYHGEPVCVFVGKDDTGKAKFACMRSITGSLRKDVYGSDKEYSFCYPPKNPGSRHVAVFEAPIDALSHATLQGLRNVLMISATPYQWKHIIGQRVCRRNTDETRIVLLEIWHELYTLSPVLFAPGLTGPFCQRDKCPEGKMTCGRKIGADMTPEDLLKADYPVLFEGGGT